MNKKKYGAFTNKKINNIKNKVNRKFQGQPIFENRSFLKKKK